jgi:hypothetical protein
MSSSMEAAVIPSVLRVRDLPLHSIEALLGRYALQYVIAGSEQAIPGSYWGESEAGLMGTCVYFRDDTPIHSVLHEACHSICMTAQRRDGLQKDAGGDYAEENAVCYLQIVLADELLPVGRARMWHDMDAWGYTFRLGCAQAWFEQDAEDARQWLIEHRLLNHRGGVTWALRA